VLAAHGLSVDPETSEIRELAPYVGAFSARAAQIRRNVDRLEADWRHEHPDQEPGPRMRDVWDRLASLRMPTLLVAAEHDYTPGAERNRIVAEMPRAGLAVVEGARHALPVERPTAFNARVGRFLERVQADGLALEPSAQ